MVSKKNVLLSTVVAGVTVSGMLSAEEPQKGRVAPRVQMLGELCTVVTGSNGKPSLLRPAQALTVGDKEAADEAKMGNIYNEMTAPVDKDLVKRFAETTDSSGEKIYHQYGHPDIIGDNGKPAKDYSSDQVKDLGMYCASAAGNSKSLEAFLLCLESTRREAGRKAAAAGGQFIVGLGGMNGLLKAKDKMTGNKFFEKMDDSTNGWRARGMQAIDDLAKKCVPPTKNDSTACDDMAQKLKRRFAAFAAHHQAELATTNMSLDAMKKHELSPEVVKFDLCESVSDAKKPKEEKEKKKGDSFVDQLFNTGPGGSGKRIDCPDFFPREFCGAGGKFDPRNWNADAGNNLAKGLIGANTYTYSKAPDDNLGKTKTSKIMEIGYQATRKSVRDDLQQFLLEGLVEGYISRVFQSEYGSKYNDRIKELKKAASCHKGTDGRPTGEELVKSFSALAPRTNAMLENQESYKVKAAMAGVCAGEIQDRLAKVMRILGQGVDANGLSFADVAKKYADAFLAKSAEVIDQKTGGKDRSWSKEKGADVLKTATDIVVRMVEGLPAINPVTRMLSEMKFAKFSAAITDGSPCAIPHITRANLNRCMDYFREFALLGREADELFKQFPVLGESFEQKPVFRYIADSAPGGLRERVEGYNFDPHQTDAHRYDKDGGFRSCMQRVAAPIAHADDAMDRFDEFSGALTKLVDGPMHAADKLAKGEILDGFLDEIKKLCNADEAEKQVDIAVRNPGTMNAFFNCDRSRMPTLFASTDIPQELWPRAMSASECQNRIDASWVLCREYKQVTANETRWSDVKAVGAGTIQLAMDLMATTGGRNLVGGLPTKLARGSAGSIFKSGVQLSGLGYVQSLLQDSPEDIRRRAEAARSQFRQGYGSYDSLVEADRAMAELAKTGDPMWKSIAHGFWSGVAFGTFFHHGEGGAGKTPVEMVAKRMEALKRGLTGEEALARDQALVKSYADLIAVENDPLVRNDPKAAKVFNAQKARKALEKAAEARFKQVFPYLGKRISSEIPIDQKMAMLNSHAEFQVNGDTGVASQPVDPAKTFGSVKPGDKLVWTYKGKPVNATFVGFDPDTSRVTLKTMGGATRTVPLEQLIASADRGSLRLPSQKQGWNFNGPIKDSPLFKIIKGAHVFDENGDFLKEVQRTMGPKVKCVYNPRNQRIEMAPDASIYDVMAAIQEAQAWNGPLKKGFAIANSARDLSSSDSVKSAATALEKVMASYARRQASAQQADAASYEAAKEGLAKDKQKFEELLAVVGRESDKNGTDYKKGLEDAYKAVSDAAEREHSVAAIRRGIAANDGRLLASGAKQAAAEAAPAIDLAASFDGKMAKKVAEGKKAGAKPVSEGEKKAIETTYEHAKDLHKLGDVDANLRALLALEETLAEAEKAGLAKDVIAEIRRKVNEELKRVIEEGCPVPR